MDMKTSDIPFSPILQTIHERSRLALIMPFRNSIPPTTHHFWYYDENASLRGGEAGTKTDRKSVEPV